MNDKNTSMNDDDIDLYALFETFRQERKIIAALTGLATIVAALFAFLLPPKYETIIQVDAPVLFSRNPALLFNNSAAVIKQEKIFMAQNMISMFYDTAIFQQWRMENPTTILRRQDFISQETSKEGYVYNRDIDDILIYVRLRNKVDTQQILEVVIRSNQEELINNTHSYLLFIARQLTDNHINISKKRIAEINQLLEMSETDLPETLFAQRFFDQNYLEFVKRENTSFKIHFPTLPEIVFPQPVMIMIAGIMAGLLAGCSVAVIRATGRKRRQMMTTTTG